MDNPNDGLTMRQKQQQKNIGRWGTSNEQQWKNIESVSEREIKKTNVLILLNLLLRLLLYGHA